MILLRHGQSEFNRQFTLTRRDPGIKDPDLTELGRAQAEQAALRLDDLDLRRCIVSPYTRALQTAAPIVARRGLPVTVDPRVRERYAFVCDVGSPRARLQASWPGHDFAAIDEVWWPDAREAEDGVIARAGAFRREMAAREDWRHTLVVSHWGFLLALSGTSLQNGDWMRYDPNTPAPSEIIWRP